MPRHLISDAHEWINEIPTVPVYYPAQTQFSREKEHHFPANEAQHIFNRASQQWRQIFTDRAMDATQTSRKRNHASSSPFGRLTRSRSQLSLHRNRSGQTYSDPVKTEKPYPEPVLVCKKTKRDVCELSRSQLTKDLRARRVYSPQSTIDSPSEMKESEFLVGSAVESDCTDRKIDDSGLGFGSSTGDATMGTVVEATEGSDERLSCKAGGNIDSSDENGKLLEQKQRGGENGDCSEKIDDAGDELVLTATPDAEIFGDSKASEDGVKQEEKVPEDSPYTGNAEENATEKISKKDSKGNDSVIKSRSVPRQRFRGILFKAPGSVSYKRLFPFLRDILGEDSGTPYLSHSQKDESQLPLSSQNQEASKYEPKTNNCTMHDTNVSKLTSHNLPESPMQLDAKEVTSESLNAPSGDDKCLSESKADPTANFHGVKNPGKALHNDNFKQYSICKNGINCTSEQFGVLNEEFILTTPPDAEIHDNSEVNVHQLGSMLQDVYYVKPVDLTRNAQENAGEGCCLKDDKTKRSLKSKSVPRPHLHRKLFKTPGSVSFRRLLPFIMDLTKEDSGTSEFGDHGHHQKDEADMHAKKFQLTSSTQSEEASVSDHKVDFCSKHDKVESNALENNILVNPSDGLSHGNEPKLIPSQDLPTLSMQPETKEVVHECLSDPFVSEQIEKVLIALKDECLSESNSDTSLSSQNEEAFIDEHMIDLGSKHGTNELNALKNNILVNPSDEMPFQDLPKLSVHLDTKEVFHECLSDLLVNEHTEKVLIDSEDECSSESKFDPCSTLEDFECAEDAVNGADNDGFKQVPTGISRQNNFESPTEDHNMFHTDGDISNLMYEHHSSKEKGLTVDREERNQFVCLEKCESVSRCPPEGQNLRQLSPNILNVEENGTSSHAISRSNDALVLDQVGISNDKLKVPSENIPSEKLDKAAHGHRAGNVLKGIVYGSKMPSKGIDDKNASCAGESIHASVSKTTSVLNRCPRIKLLKHTGSLNYKRLLPFFLDNVKDNSSSNIRETPIRDSKGCVSVNMEQCRGDCDTPQQACRINNDSSSSRSQIPEFQSLHDSCEVIQLLDEQIVFNGLCKQDESTDQPISVHQIGLPCAPLGPINGVITSRETTSALSESSDYSEVKGNSSFPISSNEMQPETIGCCHSLSQRKVLEKLKVPDSGSKKGILKRNPRGCRGLCTCLNCASFRLHAERAFEFSRNQLLDAEEVAQDLMKDLSHLRCMLERSIDDGNNNFAFDGDQVKEACRKALAAEQCAKDRLSQMNEELNIHCRVTSLQPPRVSFAEQVEEKVIQPAKQISG